MDHIGYQTSSNADYDRLKPEFQKIGELLTEDIIGGRRVGIFKLSSSLKYKQYVISAIELIAPKEGQVCPSALEHAEFVIDRDFKSFMSCYPNLTWDTSAINQDFYAMLKLKLGKTTQVKFHRIPVLEIVKLRTKTGNK
jgi:predicted metalloenzyme YecM